MCDDNLLEELLDRWDDERSAGRIPDMGEICKDHPEAIPLLRVRIHDFLAMDRALHKHLQSSPAVGEVASYRSSIEDAGSCVTTTASYRIIRLHACGGLGEVVIAHDESLSRQVALKRMQSSQRHDPARRRRFLREAAITGQLDHPGIVSILNVGEDETGNPCYTMKFVDGETLAESVRRQRQRSGGTADAPGNADPSADDSMALTPSHLRSLLSRFVSVCNTVAYAHSQNVIHRDIKPANIMLGEFGATYVVDWGLARRGRRDQGANSVAAQPMNQSLAETRHTVDSITDEDDDHLDAVYDNNLTRTGSIIGTPAFMSPEQASGDSAKVGPLSDIYCLGATLYYVLTGRAPIVSGGDAAWLDHLRHGTFPKPSDIQNSIPVPLEAICLKAMSLNPASRYGTAIELATDIEHWLADQPVSAMPESLSERLARFTRRHKAWSQSMAAAVAIVAVVAVAFAVLLNTQKNIATLAESRATILAVQKSRLAEQKSELAERETAARKTADEQNQLSLATLKSVVFNISRKLKSVAGASDVRQSLLKTSIDGLNRVARSLDTRAEIDRNLMTAHNDIGRTYLLAGNVDGTDSTAEALKHYTRANDICQKLVAETPDDPQLQRDMSVSYELIGDVQQQLGDLKLAEVAYAKSLVISEQQVVKSPNDHELKRDVAFGFEKLGDIRLAREQIDLAKVAYVRCHQLYIENVQANPDNSMLQRDLLVAQSKLGNLLLAEGDLPAAVTAYRECIATCRALENIPDSGSQPRDLSLMLNKLGGVLQKQSLLMEAAEAFNDALKIATQIAEADPTDASAQRDLSISLNNVGDVRLLEGQLDPARNNFLRGLEIRRALATKDASSQVAQTDIAQSLLRLGELEQTAAQPKEASGYFSEALVILLPLKEADKLQSAADHLLLETVQKHLAKATPEQ